MSEDWNEPDQKRDLPSLREMLASVKVEPKKGEKTQVRYEQKFHSMQVEAQRDYAHLFGLQTHYSHRRKWSIFLMVAMGAMLLFQSTLLGLVGAGIWDFRDYNWLLPALLVQNLAQIIGLAIIVVKALFKDKDPM